MSGIANDSRFSQTSNYFVPVATEAGGTPLESTILITPDGITGRINTNLPSTISGSILELGPSTTNYKTVSIYDNGLVGGAGLNIASGEPATSFLNIVGPASGATSAYIRVNSSVGTESLTLGANPVVNNNIVLTPTTTTVNTSLTTGADDDIINGGIYRRSNASPNQAITVPCPTTSSGDVNNFATPADLLPGLYAITISAGADNRLYAAYYASGLLYWNGTQWTSGGFNCNPGVLNGFGVRLLNNSPGAQLTFCHGSPTPPSIGAGGVNINFCLLMSGPNFATQLAPFA